MKKLLIIAAALFLMPLALFAQGVIEGGIGLQVIDRANNLIGFKGGKHLHFQIGKFVNNRSIATFSIGYNFGMKRTFDDQIAYETFFGREFFPTKHTIEVSALTLAYEGKTTVGYNDFDDVWTYYLIGYYGFSLMKYKDYIEPTAANEAYQKGSYLDKPTKASRTSFDIGYGFGMGRKVTQDMYVYADIKAGAAISLNTRLLIYTGFGVRKLF